MQMKNRVIRLTALAALLAAFAGMIAPGAGAQSTAELTIHHRLCADNYVGGSEWDECHDVLVGTPFEFTIEGSSTFTATTDVGTGNASFGAIPAGTYHLFGGVPGEFSNQTIYCSDEITGNDVAVNPGEIGVSIDIPAGASVVCDVYEFPLDLNGDPDPTPVPTAIPTKTPDSGQGVSRLPNTGAGGDGVSISSIWMIAPALIALAFGLIARGRTREARQRIR